MPWKSNTYFTFSASVCSLSSPVFKEYVPCYIVICGLSWRNHVFPHYLISGTISRGVGWGGIEYEVCGISFSATFVWNISHSKKSSGRCYHKCTQVFMSCKVPLLISDFNETWSLTVSKNNQILKFHQNLPSGGRVPCGQTDGWTEVRTERERERQTWRNE